MKKLILLITMALTLCATNKAEAYDFSAVNADGQTIYYLFHGAENCVYVVFEGDHPGHTSVYSGIINIPSTVVHNETTYTVEGIMEEAFSNCNITSVTIPNSVTVIGKKAFFGCSNLTSVSIGNSVTTIGISAFESCNSLTSVIIPNSVSEIKRWAFQSCSALTSVIIGTSVATIDLAAFSGCSSLASVIIPNSVTTIGYSAFEGCSSLTSIIIPDSITAIYDDTFKNCSSLTSVIIGNSVTTIGDFVFDNCNSLASVSMGSSVETIGLCAFRDCSSLTSIDIPNSVTTIGRDAFRDCNSLASVTIGNSVTTIGEYAFEDCGSLTSITIPASVDNIGSNAFGDCALLEDVVCLGEEPPVLVGAGWFEGTPINRRLHVLCSSLEAYKASTWRTCFSQDNIICENSSLEEAEGGLDSAIWLFPNPASDFATLSLDNLETDAEVVVCDLQGRVVSRQSVAAGSQNIALDLSNLAAGTYSVTITSSEGMTTRKLIKQ